MNIRSIQLIKDIKSKIELVKFQYYLMERIQDESDPVLKKLKSEVLTDEELLEVITTHPLFKVNAQKQMLSNLLLRQICKLLRSFC